MHEKEELAFADIRGAAWPARAGTATVRVALRSISAMQTLPSGWPRRTARKR
jgi:hypothetical protein